MLAGGTTLGVVALLVVQLPALARAGLVVRPSLAFPEGRSGQARTLAWSGAVVVGVQWIGYAAAIRWSNVVRCRGKRPRSSSWAGRCSCCRGRSWSCRSPPAPFRGCLRCTNGVTTARRPARRRRACVPSSLRQRSVRLDSLRPRNPWPRSSSKAYPGAVGCRARGTAHRLVDRCARLRGARTLSACWRPGIGRRPLRRAPPSAGPLASPLAGPSSSARMAPSRYPRRSALRSVAVWCSLAGAARSRCRDAGRDALPGVLRWPWSRDGPPSSSDWSGILCSGGPMSSLAVAVARWPLAVWWPRGGWRCCGGRRSRIDAYPPADTGAGVTVAHDLASCGS